MNDIILGIESSCDETAAAVVRGGREILSDVIASSADMHEVFGGVVPEIASRQHLLYIMPVIEKALRDAAVTAKDITAIAVTHGPGLIGSLLTGVSAAKALSYAWEKPLIPVHHLASHVAANYLEDAELKPPFIALIVSGAHSHIVKVHDYVRYEILARTRDDAPGEAFDKIARELGLGYRGGAKLDAAAEHGDDTAFSLPRTSFEDSYDFSFSGLKTAALNQLNKDRQKHGADYVATEKYIADFSAVFRAAVVGTLLDHTEAVLRENRVERFAVAGGVSANKLLRGEAASMCDRLGIKLTIPRLRLCTDNAAMVASQGYYNYVGGLRGGLDLNAYSQLNLDDYLLQMC